MLILLFHILMVILFCYLLASTGYLMWLAIAGKVRSAYSFGIGTTRRNITILIPAYREDAIILQTARSAYMHRYTGGELHVIVLADGLKDGTVEVLRALKVEVLSLDFELSSKGRALNAATNLLSHSEQDFVVILDADNLLEEGCLHKISAAFDQGFRAIQVHRTAKNLHTPIALLDAISEEINLNIFRRGAFNAGLSAAPMGSGMAFSNTLFLELFRLPQMLSTHAEDREVENYLLQHGIRLGFIDDAFVYDEKVSSAGALKKQRVRWMEAQLNQLRFYWNSPRKKGKVSKQYFHTFLQTFLLPRVFYLLLTAILLFAVLVSYFLGNDFMFPGRLLWLFLICAYWLVLFISIPAKFRTSNTLRALLSLPSAIFAMLGALLKLKRNRKEFLHTSKNYVHEEN